MGVEELPSSWFQVAAHAGAYCPARQLEDPSRDARCMRVRVAQWNTLVPALRPPASGCNWRSCACPCICPPLCPCPCPAPCACPSAWA